MVTDAEILAGYQRSVKRVRDNLTAFAETLWKSSPGYRDRDIDRLIKQLEPRVKAAQMQIANLTSAYVKASGGVGVPVERALVTEGRGVPFDEVYRRPAIEVYTNLSKGQTFDAAVSAGLDRLMDLTKTDMQMAKVRQSQRSYQGSRIQFYRRVLKGAKNCALCVIASTQRYSVEHLMPIHPGCDCDQAELKSGEDVDHVIDQKLLDDTHAQVRELAGVSDRGGRGLDYTELIVTNQHGEIGPVLGWRDHKFRGPDDLLPTKNW